MSTNKSKTSKKKNIDKNTISVSVGGNLTGNLIIGDNNTTTQQQTNPDTEKEAGNQNKLKALKKSELFGRTRELLLKTRFFRSNASLSALFSHPALKAWKYNVPEATTASQRVDLLLQELDTNTSDGRQGICVFIEVLLDGWIDKELEIYAEFETVFKELNSLL